MKQNKRRERDKKERRVRGKTKQKSRRRTKGKAEKKAGMRIRGKKRKEKKKKMRGEKEQKKVRRKDSAQTNAASVSASPPFRRRDTRQQRPLKYIQSVHVLLPYKVHVDGYARIRYVDSFFIRLAFHHGRGLSFTFSSNHGRPTWCKNGNRCLRLAGATFANEMESK